MVNPDDEFWDPLGEIPDGALGFDLVPRGPSLERALGEARAHLGDPDPEVRRLALDEVRRLERELGLRRVTPLGDPDPHVGMLLDTTEKGNPKRTPSNVHYILAEDHRWKGRIRTNLFDGLVYLDQAVVSDPDLTEIVIWLDRVYNLVTNEDRVGKTLNVIGDRNAWHPVREFLYTLTWDGVPRLDRLLEHYFNAELPPDDAPVEEHTTKLDLIATLGRCFMISCVARVLPVRSDGNGGAGCKVDTTLILQGPQGAFKSTGASILANPVANPAGGRRQGWFADTTLDLHTKDLYECLQGVWIYELGELDGVFNRGDWARIKALLSSPTDRWRRPYGRSVQERQRQVVFFGTTNEPRFLGDPTGSRRFWVVRVGAARVAELQRDVEQLWAEAVHRYWMGEPWWLNEQQGAALAESNREFTLVPAIADTIGDYCSNEGWPDVTVALVCRDVLHLAPDRYKASERDVAAALRHHGYEMIRLAGPGRPTVWRKRR